MPRAVLDANVLVSAILSPRGSPTRVLQALEREEFQVVVSEATVEELGRVLLYPKIRGRLGWTSEQAREFVENVAKIAILTPGKVRLHVVAEDPADDRYLECAAEGDAEYLVSGDAHLLRLEVFEGIRIVTASEFLEILQETEGRE